MARAIEERSCWSEGERIARTRELAVADAVQIFQSLFERAGDRPDAVVAFRRCIETEFWLKTVESELKSADHRRILAAPSLRHLYAATVQFVTTRLIAETIRTKGVA